METEMNLKTNTVLFAALAVAGLSLIPVARAGDCGSNKGYAKTASYYKEHHEKPANIIAAATGEGMSDVTTLVTAIKAAGLVETLQGEGPFTVFAPTNAAFAKLPAGTVETLLKPENKEQLKSILLYHVHVGQTIKAADVLTMKLGTANGADLDIKVADGAVMVNNAKVIRTDILTGNGVIHWIDNVVLPPAK
jgi:transforming growth factor-beta-induced protein